MADETKINFSLPGDESGRAGGRHGGTPVLSLVIAALIAVVLMLQVYEFYIRPAGGGSSSANGVGLATGSMDAGTEKAVALVL